MHDGTPRLCNTRGVSHGPRARKKTGVPLVPQSPVIDQKAALLLTNPETRGHPRRILFSMGAGLVEGPETRPASQYWLKPICRLHHGHAPLVTGTFG